MRLQCLFSLTIFLVLLVGWNPANARFGEEEEEDYVDDIRILDDIDGDIDGDEGGSSGTMEPTPPGSGAGGDVDGDIDGGDYDYYEADGDIDGGDYDYYDADGDIDGGDYDYYDADGDSDGDNDIDGDAGGGDGGTIGPTPSPADNAGGIPTPSPVEDAWGPTTPTDNAGGIPTPSPVEDAWPTNPTPAPVYPTWPTLPPVTPTESPVVPYEATDDDPLQEDTDDEIKNEWGWDNETLEEMEHDRNVIIALSVVGAVGLCFALISAQQIIENPDGCCASICRLFVACIFGVFRCVCWPCRWVCGCTGRDRRNHDLIMAGDSNYTHDLELS